MKYYKRLQVYKASNNILDLVNNTKKSLDRVSLEEILVDHYNDLYLRIAVNTTKRKPESTQDLQDKIDKLVSFIGKDLTNEEKQKMMDDMEVYVTEQMNLKYAKQAYKLLERDAKNTYVDIDGVEYILPIDKALELNLVNTWNLRHTFKAAFVSLNI